MTLRTLGPTFAAGLSAGMLLLHGCGSQPPRSGLPPSSAAVRAGNPSLPHREPLCRKGNPSSYDVFGKRYFVMKSGAGYHEQGIASWYGPTFQGHQTSCGNTYDMYEMTAAHKTLPIPTYCEVTNLDNGRKTIVKVNDRGPFHDDRIIDLSYAAALQLGVVAKGTANVQVRALDAGLPLAAEGGELAQAAAPVQAARSGAQVDPALTTSLSARQAERLAAEVRMDPPNPAWRSTLSPYENTDREPAIGLSAGDRGKQLLPARDLPEAPTTAPSAVSAAPIDAGPESAPALASPASVTNGAGNMFLQVGAFAQRDNAERLKTELDRVVREHVQIQRSGGPSNGLYRVHIGPLANSVSVGRIQHTLFRLGLSNHRLIVD